MELPKGFKQMVVIQADYNDVEELIKSIFGFEEYNIPAEEEQGNDTSIELSLDGKFDDEIGKYRMQDVQKALATKKPQSFKLSIYLDYAVSIGKIPPGDYVISICW